MIANLSGRGDEDVAQAAELPLEGKKPSPQAVYSASRTTQGTGTSVATPVKARTVRTRGRTAALEKDPGRDLG
jgi:hypothetical protein